MRTTRQTEDERAERAIMRLLRTLPELHYRGACLLCGLSGGAHADACFIPAMQHEIAPMEYTFAPWMKRRMQKAAVRQAAEKLRA